MRDNPRMHDPDFMAVWVWCLLEATYSEKESLLGGKKIVLKPGQFTTGRKQLSELSGVQESKIERVLNFFTNELQIEQQKTNTNRLISIINWKSYQDIEQQMNNKRTTDEQQVNTPKEYKKVNKEKKEKNIIDNVVLETIIPIYLKESFDGFEEMRRSIKKPITEYAKKKIVEKLEKLYPANIEKQIECLNQSTMNCWQGVFEIKQEVQNKPRFGYQPSTKEESLAQMERIHLI